MDFVAQQLIVQIPISVTSNSLFIRTHAVDASRKHIKNVDVLCGDA